MPRISAKRDAEIRRLWDEMPKVRPVFRLTLTEGWLLDCGIQAGDELILLDPGTLYHQRTMTRPHFERTGSELGGVKPQNLDFIEYRDIRLLGVV